MTIAAAMPTRKTSIVALTVAAGASPSTPEHKRFQTLLGRIEKARERLAAWQREVPVFAEAYARRVEPLQQELSAHRRAWAFELEAILLGQRWTPGESACLVEMICGLSGALLGLAEEPDAELKSLHDRHADESWDDAERRRLQEARVFVERMSGIELGDEPIASMDELRRKAQEQLRRAAQAEPGGDASSDAGTEGRPRQRRPSGAQRRAQEAQQRISQNVREVYRKLASALHPDRVPADATGEQREAATALMQRANAAYEAGDLLALLELQLHIEQVDALHVAGVPAEQVRHFNRVLAEQLRELEQEIDERQQAFCSSYGYAQQLRLDPRKLEALLREEVQSMAIARARIAHDRRTLRGDLLSARRFLKHWHSEQHALAQLRAGAVADLG